MSDWIDNINKAESQPPEAVPMNSEQSSDATLSCFRSGDYYYALGHGVAIEEWHRYFVDHYDPESESVLLPDGYRYRLPPSVPGAAIREVVTDDDLTWRWSYGLYSPRHRHDDPQLQTSDRDWLVFNNSGPQGTLWASTRDIIEWIFDYYPYKKEE